MTSTTPAPTPLPAPLPTPAKLSVRDPEDVLAAVPVVLGFQPQDSVVMLTFGGAHQFHARVDLPDPDDPAQVGECVRALLAPARLHRVGQAMFVLYTSDDPLARRLARRLRHDVLGARIEMLACLRVDAGRWFLPLGGGAPGGVPYDVADHPFRARAIFDGNITEPSRAALAARLDPDPDAVAAVADVCRETEPLDLDGVERLLGALLAGATPTPRDLAGLLLAVASTAGRDRAWSRMTRATASEHVSVWTAMVRSAPPHLVAQPAALLAFASWLAGHGALAWCAVDRCLAEEPEHRLARLVGDVLTRAVAPADWEPAAASGGAA